ncbi:MAG: hypothetical protein WD557_02905 [Dehalococcoidia bacterium]
MMSRLPATRHADFRALWYGSACSSVSLWTMLLANAWIVYELSDSSFWVGVSTFASMSPYLVAPWEAWSRTGSSASVSCG